MTPRQPPPHSRYLFLNPWTQVRGVVCHFLAVNISVPSHEPSTTSRYYDVYIQSGRVFESLSRSKGKFTSANCRAELRMPFDAGPMQLVDGTRAGKGTTRGWKQFQAVVLLQR